ncbi:Uncharacterised protein [Mycobacteroides abscessus subsp. bolletii]|nr:Uncharacterised protein [Mycobacteroides abscessus subsp. abscessus]SIM22940.1 Uncharacterised protein [Mycobacteroides abscessus subsp. bolletii]
MELPGLATATPGSDMVCLQSNTGVPGALASALATPAKASMRATSPAWVASVCASRNVRQAVSDAAVAASAVRESSATLSSSANRSRTS